MSKSKLQRVLDLLSDRQALDLMLVFTGSRPACLIMDPDKEQTKELRELCNSENLAFTVKEDNTEGLGSHGFFISRQTERLEMLENSEGRFYGLSDLDVGRFLGFPRQDTEYFHRNISENPVEPEIREKTSEMISKGEISSKEAKIVDLVSYVPKPSDEGVKRAIRKAKNYIDDLEEFDRRNGTDAASKVLEDFLNTPDYSV